jgi:lysine/ornithine N-monooxygenase
MPAELHKKFLLRDRPEDAKTISLELIEHIYEKQVALEKASHNAPMPPPKNDIIPMSEVVACDLGADGRARLSVRNTQNQHTNTLPTAFDLVVYATGYTRCGCKRLLRSLQPLVQDRSGQGINANLDNMVEFRRGVVASHEGVGVWVIGGFEGGSDVSVHWTLMLRWD